MKKKLKTGGLEDLVPYPHETEAGYCCACGYDVSYFANQISAQADENTQLIIKKIKTLDLSKVDMCKVIDKINEPDLL